MAKIFLVVAGNMGVGKTTLVELLSDRLGWHPFFEPAEENPYLADFYKDMGHWGFHSQLFFLIRRFELHQQIAHFPDEAIQDRCIYEDAEIFAFNLREVMEEREYQLYQMLYEGLVSELPAPDLVLYLQASVETLMKRIRRRGRGFENGVHRASNTYLEQLNRLYEEWAEGFNRCPILTIPTDDLDFVSNREHLDFIAEEIIDSLNQAAGG